MCRFSPAICPTIFRLGPTSSHKTRQLLAVFVDVRGELDQIAVEPLLHGRVARVVCGNSGLRIILIFSAMLATMFAPVYGGGSFFQFPAASLPVLNCPIVLAAQLIIQLIRALGDLRDYID